MVTKRNESHDDDAGGNVGSHGGIHDLAVKVDVLSQRVYDLDGLIKRMAACFQLFRNKYEEHLKDQVDAAGYRKGLRRKIITAAIMSGLATMTLFLLGLLAVGFQGWMRSWLVG